MTDRKLLKKDAREAIRAAKPSPVLVTLAILLILTVTQILSLSLNGELDAIIAMAKKAAQGEIVLIEAAGSSGVFPWLLTIALDLMTMVVSMGYTLYTMRVHRRQGPGFGDVFDAFAFFWRVIVLSILRSFLMSIASVIYVLPATALGMFIDPLTASLVCLPFLAGPYIVMYVYRLADYILLDHPDYPAIQCLGMSRLATSGRKWEMFRLDLSFLGWVLLCIFPPMLLWVMPYTRVTFAGYYDAVMPDFMEKFRQRAEMFRADQERGFRNNSGGWSVPGESPDDDDSDDTDDE